MSAPATLAACLHCALPVRAEGSPYCCLGCRLAHRVSAGGEGGDGAGGTLEARLLVAAVLSMGVMTLSLVLWAEELLAAGGEHGLSQLGGLGRAAQALLALPVLALLGGPLLEGALDDLRRRVVRLDGLVVLAVGAGWLLSSWHVFVGSGPVYFDTGAMVLLLVTFGRRLEAHARRRGADAAEALLALLPARAHRRDDAGAWQDVAPAELAAGERVQVRPGEALPADGRVLTGVSELSTAHLTGEERPRAVAPGDRAPAGAVNGAGVLELEVTARAGDGSLARLRALLESPLDAVPAVRAADRLAGVLTAVTCALAVVAGLAAAWPADGGWAADAGLRTALSVLLVACPCALGLATPLAYRAERAALARHGVLVRRVGALEQAARVDRVVLDKTGTLTRPSGGFRSCGPMPWPRWAAPLVRASGHPLAEAFAADDADAAGVAGVADDPAGELRSLPGRGVVEQAGTRVRRVGSPLWMDALELRWSDALRDARRAAEARGDTLVVAAEGDAVVGLGRVESRLRAGAAEAVDALRATGVGLELSSGDAVGAVDALGAELGLPAAGAQRPEDKDARVAALQADGHVVAFVGDGLNDGAALRRADVSVAPSWGTDLARDQADVELVCDDLRAVPRLLEGARRLRRTVRGNLAWTVAYNAVALAAACTGRLHPLVAVSAMVASSLVVSGRSRRLLPRAGEGTS